MTLVLDASVALKWYLAEPESELAESLALRSDLIAPDLIVAEVANGLWRSCRMGRLLPADADAAAAAAPRAFARLVPAAELVPAAMPVARALDHPICDCLYIALAMREAALLVTADRRLLAAVAGTAWAGHLRDLAAFGRASAGPPAGGA